MSAEGWTELIARDAEARRLAQTEFTRPIVLEAGAGTGKTAILVARLVAWLLGPGWERARAEQLAEHPHAVPDAEAVAVRALGGVVAITFTEPAAGEMALRVGQTLTAVAAGENPDWLLPAALAAASGEAPQRALALAGSLDRLVVSTIHAFCRRLLAAHPLAAGLHPSFAVDADGTAVEQVVREVVGKAAGEALGPRPDPDWLELAVAGHGPAELAGCVEVLIEAGLPPEALETDPIPSGWRNAAVAGLARAAEAVIQAGAGFERGARVIVALAVVEAAKLTRDLARPGAGESLESLDHLGNELRQVWEERLRTRLAAWAGAKLKVSEEKAVGAAAESLVAAAGALHAQVAVLTELQPMVLERARRVVRPLLATARQRLRARGWVTFGDLLRGARDLVRREPTVGARWRQEVRQLLVDEFQDTDRLQCEILAALVLDAPERSRPGLFLVGDPKQSIYGWRSADLAAYHDFVSRVIDRDGGLLAKLCVSFRSVPVLLEAVKTWVGPHLVERPGVQAGFQPLAPCPQNQGEDGFRQGRWAPVEIWISSADEELEAAGGRGGGSREASELEAARLARDLVELHSASGTPWSEVGILVRTSSDLDLVLEALRDAGVPFVVERDRSYYQRREILDATALVESIVDPTDFIALVAWLRSPAVGVPDAAWLPLWRRGFPGLITDLSEPAPAMLAELSQLVDGVASSLPTDVPGLDRISGWAASLKVALAGLAELRASFRRDPAVRFVERLRETTLVEATAAARFLGRFRVANLQRFFRRLIAALDDGETDAHEILRRLRRAVRAGRDEEEARPTTALEDAVRVMTIHRAKGLDFSHVYLLQTHKQSQRGGTPPNAAWEGREGWEYRLLGVPTPGWRLVVEQQRRVAEAELVRTLYVAATRAKRRLVLAGKWPRPGAAVPAGSHLALLAAHSELPEPGMDGTADTEAGRFVWLSRLSMSDVGRSWPDRDDARALLEQARTDARRLAARRREAALRMALPFSVAASAEAHRALEALLAARSADADEAPTAVALRPQSNAPAMLIGSAVHWLLETIPLDRALAEALAGCLDRLAGWVRRQAPPGHAAAVLSGAHAVLTRFAASPLAERWEEVRRHVMGREVPLLLPPDGTDAVGYVAGQIDLLYRDPLDGCPVVVDFKTDEVATPEEVAARASAYASQCATYARGVQAALRLPLAPRWELWFLRVGLAVKGEVPDGGAAG
ncbi:MAG: UvrD-helicase domain-containing protein [Thermoanaerobaculaceae bacterium]|nr:UvrD-helicase domain-containing protein [Thermoanaerobaculaceae bacterium]MDI9622500.1 UvrD-helicase domain-containing protein [Acidobacteriota bacterium]NLH12017.1 UvrD-helicase domain-containing protein [Holophagae bacterium]HPW56174.1 UvrD-helicase domain-containing protein [Thermoanaerobaculaceae bacterium]